MKKSVLLLMGSDSDWKKMEPCVLLLKSLGIDCDVRICSAHRTPNEAQKLAVTARQNGVGVIIAAAGMAAHLAGAMAAHTTLPVIGVPLSGGISSGLDALLATVQMPPGVPVATVTVDGSVNAGWLAAQILGVSDADIEAKLIRGKEAMATTVNEKNEKLQAKLP